MTAPAWMSAVIRDFGRAAGAAGLAFNERGAAALAFEKGASLRLEYTGEELVMAITVPWHGGEETLKRLLSFSHPKARYGFRIRAGILQKSNSLVMAVRFAERDVTLPQVNSAFGVLWRLSGEIGGAA